MASITADVRHLRDIVSVGGKFAGNRKDGGSALLLKMVATAKTERLEVSAVGPENQVLVQTMPCRCSGVFECLVSPKRLGAILTSISTETVEVSTNKKDQIVVKASGSEFKLSSEAFDTFPALDPTVPDHTTVTMTVAELYRSLSHTLAVCDRESTRFALGAVLIDVGTTLAFVATDSRRLVYSPRKTVKGSDNPFQFLLPSAIGKGLVEILRRADMTGTVQMQLSHKRGAFIGEGFTLATASVDGQYPNWRAMLGKANSELVMEGPIGALRRAGRMVAVMTHEESRGVKIRINDSGSITASTEAPNIGDSVVEIAAETKRYEYATEFDSGYFVAVFDGQQDADVVEWRQETCEDMAYFHLPDEMIHILMPLARN